VEYKCMMSELSLSASGKVLRFLWFSFNFRLCVSELAI
jgi:hypothetical protein